MRFFFLALVVGFSLAFWARSEPVRKIPFCYQDGLIWLKVELAGKKEPLNFLLDSGSSASTIDLQTAQAFGIPLRDRQSIQGVSGSDFAYRVDGFQATVGGILVPRSVLAIDLGAVSGRCHQHIDGILGFDFFRNRILQIDFIAGEISLLESYSPNLAKCDILPMKMCNGAFCVPLRVAGNSQHWMRFDTGCDSALEWVVTGTQGRRLEGPSIGVSAASVYYVNTSVRVGKHGFDHVIVGIHTKEIFPGEDGLLGNALLSKFCVTIDARRSRVIFENPR